MDSSCAAAPDTCTGDSSSNDLDFWANATAAFSVMGLSTVLLMQLDGISRRILAPPRLLAKRRQEYKYTVEQSSEYNALMMRQHVGWGKGVYDPKTETSVWETIFKNDTNEMEEIIAEILNAKKPSPVIVAMEQDLFDDADPNTYHLFLAFPPPASDESVATPGPPKLYRRVRVPLVVFCERLAKAFEGQMTSTALCFVADASSGMGSETLTNVVKECNHGVATISNPAWMTFLSLLISKANKTHSITTQQFERIIFSLCRLDAWRVRDSVGISRTVLFSLPGQACVPLILPLIQKVFVHERHVFVYDGCCYSVEMGTALRKQYGSSYRQQAAKEVWDEVSASPKVISSTFPMAPVRHNRELPETLANLNGMQASIVESWMSSVDTFLDMKSKEKKNFYTPFVCRMGFLMKRSGIGNGYGSDLSEVALKNVLEYITGSKSRALPTEVMAGAVSCLTEMRATYEGAVENSKLNADEKMLLEKCVFTHKSILIGEKTLLDTVQPKEDWSLKATKKLKSCACCIPGEESDEEDEDSDTEGGESSKPKKGMDLSVPGAFATNTGGRSKYVDGKSQFAFDPTMFNK
mmetsp:Transcript_11881/g.21957  ORF Transcript_11881/g.21957 Transcript_11881/m.21957 type:complete len:581 (-) Transcript_11881:52-1794(-)